VLLGHELALLRGILNVYKKDTFLYIVETIVYIIEIYS
jgi:hypothetical protein